MAPFLMNLAPNELFFTFHKGLVWDTTRAQNLSHNELDVTPYNLMKLTSQTNAHILYYSHRHINTHTQTHMHTPTSTPTHTHTHPHTHTHTRFPDPPTHQPTYLPTYLPTYQLPTTHCPIPELLP